MTGSGNLGSGWEGVVLTGGASARMGRDKALLRVGGTPMAVRVARALLAAGAQQVWCVGGDLDGLGAAGLAAEPDDWPGQGPLGGVLTALDRAEAPVVAVVACDLLAPDAATLRALVDGLGAHPEADVVVPLLEGRRQVLHAVWRGSAAAGLQRAWDQGERSVRRAVEAAGLRVVDVAGVDPGTQADADAPEDLPGTLTHRAEP
jgi:molybdenum cofactor guanylyltransferase